MVATSPTQTRPRWQWDPDSRNVPSPDPGNAPYNCGPASLAKIVEFYRDIAVHINALRRTAVADLRPTNVSQQKVMLERYGVPCEIAALTISQLTSIVSSGRRPTLIGLDMSRVSLATAGHPFRGAHAVVALRNETRGGVEGKLIMDPNFSPITGRRDPTNGQRWYSNAVIAYAMASPRTQRWAVVPKASKRLPTPAPTPTPAPPPTESTTQAGGLPVSFTSRDGWSATIKAYKPRRDGASLSSSNLGNTDNNGEAFPIWGEVKGQDLTNFGLPGGTRWFFGPQYIGSRWRIVYIPYADFVNRNGF